MRSKVIVCEDLERIKIGHVRVQ